MSVSLEKASKAHQGRAASFSGACAGRVRGRAEFETGSSQGLKSNDSAGDRSAQTGSLKVGQVEDVVTITTAATYSEELATCFEDAENGQALDKLSSICCKTLKTIKPLTSSQLSKEGQYWLALSRISATLGITLKALPDGD
ncbi:TPA: hypothetical protein ACH3X1_002909 [Trebouxia sp. C0004]